MYTQLDGKKIVDLMCNTVYRVLNAMLNYCEFPDLKQISDKRIRWRLWSSILKYVRAISMHVKTLRIW